MDYVISIVKRELCTIHCSSTSKTAILDFNRSSLSFFKKYVDIDINPFLYDSLYGYI